MSWTKNLLKTASAVLVVATFITGIMSCGKKEVEPTVTTAMENTVTTVTEATETVITTGADSTTVATTDGEDEPVIVTTDAKDDPESVVTTVKTDTEPIITTVKADPEPIITDPVPVDTTAKSDPEPIVTTEPKKPIVEPAVSVVEEMIVGIGTKAVTLHPGDEEYEYILSAIKKRGEGQIFEALAYDYETVDELKRAAYYVELRFKNPIGVSITDHQGVTDYSECGEIVFVLTGELNKCFVVKGRAPMEGMKQDIALVEYVQKLVK